MKIYISLTFDLQKLDALFKKNLGGQESIGRHSIQGHHLRFIFDISQTNSKVVHFFSIFFEFYGLRGEIFYGIVL